MTGGAKQAAMDTHRSGGNVPPMTVRTYDVPDISCDHCKRAIEAEIAKVAGVSEAVVTVATRTVRVEGDASDDEVRAAIDEAGYDVAGVR